MSMLALFESREGTCTSLVMLAKLLLMSMLALFESREGTALVMLAKLLL